MKNFDIQAPGPEDTVLAEELISCAQTRFGLAWSPRVRRQLLEALDCQRQKSSLSWAGYAAALASDDGLWARLWPQALAHEGSFLRPYTQFEVLEERLDRWAVMACQRRLRVLSAGCGPGFEPFSLAMALESCGLRAKNWEVDIYGVDINPQAISQAQTALFSSEDLDYLPEGARRKWFTARAGGFHFRLDLAPSFHWAQGNVYEPETWPWPLEPFDLIFCRGLASDAPPDRLSLLAQLLAQLLSDSGFIFTAPGEFLPLEAKGLFLEECRGVPYYHRSAEKLKVKRRPRRKGGRAELDLENERALTPLTIRDKALLEAAEADLQAGRLEKCRDFLDELMLSLMERGRSAPEAWALLARLEEALGREAELFRIA